MSAPAPNDHINRVSRDLNLPNRGVAAVLRLLDDGATVPFIARYRKEATGTLDEVQIRAVAERRTALAELDKRRKAVLSAIEEQGKLTDDLRKRLLAAGTRAEVEDLYLPYKRKRSTRASKARDAGLEPLARRIIAQPRDGHPMSEARRFVSSDRGIEDADAALAGARDIVAELFAERPDVRAMVRENCNRYGVLTSKVARTKSAERTPFEQYYDFREPLGRVKSHRFLAVARGEREEVLRVRLEVDEERLLPRILRHGGLQPRSAWSGQLEEAVRDGFKRLMFPSVEKEVRSAMKEAADLEAVDIFARNLRNLLLLAPLGGQPVVGIDPGLRTGCKCAAVDSTGRYQDTMTIYPARGSDAAERARQDVASFVRRYKPRAVAVGNGTGGRETVTLVREALKAAGSDDVLVLEVNEAGASVYSASDVAREELPDLDITIRGAVSIARRLQDPLAELVKIEPKSIGVGQYQHDVNQPLLRRKLGEVVESCVNHVGVELNTASPALLGHVAGIGPALAGRIVAHRDSNGAFRRRRDLLKVTGLGARTFEQAAGFLRIRDGSDPLDASAVHPERYDLVRRMAKDHGATPADLMGDPARATAIDIRAYIAGDVGEPTLRDIVAELAKPGRDPRKTFEPPKRRDDVQTMDDLRPGMTLEGAVTNVTGFGAFVDIGVKQDGLGHISQLADRFVRDPHEVVAVGDRLTVRVLEVDHQRKRISLTAKTTRK